MLVLAVMLILVGNVHPVRRMDVHQWNELNRSFPIGKRDCEQHCPKVAHTYNSTERETNTKTYGGH